jgi:hypothetical protein
VSTWTWLPRCDVIDDRQTDRLWGYQGSSIFSFFQSTSQQYRIIIIFFFPTIAATHEVVDYGGVYSLKSIRLY